VDITPTNEFMAIAQIDAPMLAKERIVALVELSMRFWILVLIDMSKNG
jgi:hypothetical protein